MKRRIYIFLMFTLVLSCTSRTIYKKPKNLIEKEKMITVWTDMYIAAGAKSVKTKTLKTKINYAPLVLDKYKIDSVQFSESNIYYTSRIDEYEKMFKEVQKRLESLKKVYEPEPKKDSILPILERIDSLKTNKKALKKKFKNQPIDLSDKIYK
ncbi:MAG: DUF4296 domain-containing protein [Flavobacteriaceae bacterium]|nr:DUF4296 domain-containing protein [Flavobacteriaceae bacterium]